MSVRSVSRSLIPVKRQFFLPLGGGVQLEKNFRPIASPKSIVNRINTLYYKLRGTDLRFDTMKTEWWIDTYEFFDHLKSLDEAGNLPQTIITHGWGIGRGIEELQFFRHFKSLDEVGKTNYYSRIRHILGDFSIKMLKEVASSTMRFHSDITKYVLFDASEPLPLKQGSALFIWHKELYDDLPGNQILVYKEGKFFEKWARGMFNSNIKIKTIEGKTVTPSRFLVMFKDNKDLESLNPDFLISIGWEEALKEIDIEAHNYGKLIKEMCHGIKEDFAFPVNLGGISNMLEAIKLLDKERGGRLIIYDYGFVIPEVYSREAKDEGNKSHPIYVISGQPTTDVNFWLLKRIAEEAGASVVIEKSREDRNNEFRMEVKLL